MNKEPMTHPERRALLSRLEDALYIVQLRQERKELIEAARAVIKNLDASGDSQLTRIQAVAFLRALLARLKP
jgi:hypothetical protein